MNNPRFLVTMGASSERTPSDPTYPATVVLPAPPQKEVPLGADPQPCSMNHEFARFRSTTDIMQISKM